MRAGLDLTDWAARAPSLARVALALLVLNWAPGCSARAPLRRPNGTTLHPSCLHECRNVRKIPACSSAALAAPTMTPSELHASAATLVGERVRVRGVIGKANGVWTQIDCGQEKCCGEQLAPYLSIDDARTTGKIARHGTARLAGGRMQALECYARSGHMIESYAAASSEQPFAFSPWQAASNVEPDPSELQAAYCCSLDGHGKTVLVEAELERAPSGFAPR